MEIQGPGTRASGGSPDLQPFVGSLPFSGMGAAPIMHLYQHFLQQQQQQQQGGQMGQGGGHMQQGPGQ
jgi:hypothetical protein